MSEQEVSRDQDGDEEDHDWHNGQGESPDSGALAALHLAHRAVAKFPDLTKRYQKFIGTAAVVSSAVIVMASIAVQKRLHHGESPDKILEEITTDEIENAGREKPSPPERHNKRSRLQH